MCTVCNNELFKVKFTKESLMQGVMLTIRISFKYIADGFWLMAVIGEGFPDGLLDGAVLHWGCATRQGGSWNAPPTGWNADPITSTEAGPPHIYLNSC